MHRNYSRYILTAIGFAVVSIALLVVLTDIEARVPDKLILLPVFALGPIAIIGVLSLKTELLTQGRESYVRIGTVMLVIAFSCLTMMLVVQQNVILRAAIASDSLTSQQQEVIDLIMPTVSGVQLGMDFTFDIFIGIGMLLFAWAMYNHPRFGKIIGVFGILAASYLLISNMWAFPLTPHEAEVVDPAAIALTWWLAVIIKDETAKKKQVSANSTLG